MSHTVELWEKGGRANLGSVVFPVRLTEPGGPIRDPGNIELREMSARTGAQMGEYKWTLTEAQRRRIVAGESLDAVLAESPREEEVALSEADLAVELYESFCRQGHSEVDAFQMARGRELSEAALLNALRARAAKPPEGAAASLEGSFRTLGLSDSAARDAVRGR